MEPLCDVLLFGSMGEIGAYAQKALASEGLEVSAVAFPQNLFNDEPGYRRELCRAITRYRPRMVFPIGHPLAMSRFKAEIADGTPLRAIVNSRSISPETSEAIAKTSLIVERENVIRLLDSKVALYHMAFKLGVPQPRVFDSPSSIESGIQVVFKRDISFGGHGVHLPKDHAALENLIAHQSPGEPYLIEEFVEGQDCSLDVVRSRGNFVSSGYICLSSKGNGPALERRILDEGGPVLDKMRHSASIILEHLDYKGICGFDFRVTPSGEVLLLEANPRFTGGLSAQFASGFNIPYLLYRLTQNPETE